MKVGFIGLGRMGAGMAGRLLQAGHEVAVYNRTPSKAQGLIDRGARLAARGKQEVETRFSWAQVVARVEAVYASVLASNMIGRVN